MRALDEVVADTLAADSTWISASFRRDTKVNTGEHELDKALMQSISQAKLLTVLAINPQSALVVVVHALDGMHSPTCMCLIFTCQATFSFKDLWVNSIL